MTLHLITVLIECYPAKRVSTRLHAFCTDFNRTGFFIFYFLWSLKKISYALVTIDLNYLKLFLLLLHYLSQYKTDMSYIALGMVRHGHYWKWSA